MKSKRSFFYSWLGFCLTVFGIPFVQAQEKQSIDVYNMVEDLNEGLVYLLRYSHGSNIGSRIDRKLIGAPLQPRHVFQKALDVEQKLTFLMQTNGVRSEETKRLAIQPYSPEQVFELINALYVKVDSLLHSYGMAVHVQGERDKRKEPEDVYHLLERMDRFLLKMGAPASQPGHVFRRAQAIVFLAEKLCKGAVCKKVSRLVPPKNKHIIPLNVYEETYHLISALDRYVSTYRVALEGGVLALPVYNGMITPGQVHDLMGVVLADMIAVIQKRTTLHGLDLQDVNLEIMPRNVWVEVNYARRLLEAMSNPS